MGSDSATAAPMSVVVTPAVVARICALGVRLVSVSAAVDSEDEVAGGKDPDDQGKVGERGCEISLRRRLIGPYPTEHADCDGARSPKADDDEHTNDQRPCLELGRARPRRPFSVRPQRRPTTNWPTGTPDRVRST